MSRSFNLTAGYRESMKPLASIPSLPPIPPLTSPYHRQRNMPSNSCNWIWRGQFFLRFMYLHQLRLDTHSPLHFTLNMHPWVSPCLSVRGINWRLKINDKETRTNARNIIEENRLQAKRLVGGWGRVLLPRTGRVNGKVKVDYVENRSSRRIALFK